MSRDDGFSNFHFKNVKTKRNETSLSLKKKFDRSILILIVTAQLYAMHYLQKISISFKI